LGPLYLFSLIGINLLAGMQKNKLFNLFQILINLATVLASVVGYFQKSLFVILFVTAILWLVVDLFLIRSLLRGEKYRLRFSWDTFNQGFFYAIKAYLVNMCIFLVLRLNVVLLQKMSVPAEIGYFSIAAQITDAIALLPMTIGILLFPDLLRLTDGQDSYAKAAAAMKMVMIILVPLVICAALAAPFFIRIFYGDQFLPAIGVLNWMLPGSLFYGLVIIASQYLTACGLPKVFVFIWIFSVLLDLVLSYLFIPIFAAQGAAMVLSTTYFILFIFCAILIYLYKGKKLELQTIL
jgi:O-antigen/teichoic acid export membrane protein